METEINNTGGNAFNFINYVGVGLLFIVILSKYHTLKGRWQSAWPIFLLMLIYFVNALTAPYTNYSWVLYQEIFLTIALLLHVYSQRLEASFTLRFKKGLQFFFWMFMVLVVFCALIILSQVEVSYYISEFNEAFVQSLDDYGIMKQRYGYLMGFLLSYIFFIVKNKWVKPPLVLLILFTSFGIRSFTLGLVGASLIFVLRRSYRSIAMVLAVACSGVIFFGAHLESLVYDTRFYSYLNAIDIIEKYPFGVGLGGYPVYTEENSRILFASFYDINAILDYIPLAPESDIVHVFGSLGPILGTLHFLLIIRILWYSYKLKDSMNPFQKCILFFFCFMTFFGIGEDSIFSITYWIFFGLASGLVATLLKKPEVDRKWIIRKYP